MGILRNLSSVDDCVYASNGLANIRILPPNPRAGQQPHPMVSSVIFHVSIHSTISEARCQDYVVCTRNFLYKQYYLSGCINDAGATITVI